MSRKQVLVVEDDPIIAMDVEITLADAGWAVCGVASSEAGALRLGEETRPSFAVVDIGLSPGDGRVVATELTNRYETAVLFATSQCHDKSALALTGALACLSKPYRASDVLIALDAMRNIRAGRDPGRLPDHMVPLTRGPEGVGVTGREPVRRGPPTVTILPICFVRTS